MELHIKWHLPIVVALDEVFDDPRSRQKREVFVVTRPQYAGNMMFSCLGVEI